MNEMMVREFQGMKVRTHIDSDGKIWFSAQDLTDLLGLKYRNSALKRLVDAERGSFQCSTLGGIQEISAVNESGMYKLILRSDKPNAQDIINWITEDVLPTLRKTGSYSLVPKEEMDDLDVIDSYVKAQRAERQARKLAIAKVTQEIVMVDKKVEQIDSRVETTEKTIDQMMTIRRGDEPTPSGTIPSKKIRQRYFYGVSEDVIRDFLNYKKHPKTPFTFETDSGSRIGSFAWQEKGLSELYFELINESKFVKETPQKIMMRHRAIKKDFGFKFSELPKAIADLIAEKILTSL